MHLVLIALYCSGSVYGPGTNAVIALHCIVLTVCMDLVLIALYCSHSVYGPGTNCILLFSQCVWTW